MAVLWAYEIGSSRRIHAMTSTMKWWQEDPLSRLPEDDHSATKDKSCSEKLEIRRILCFKPNPLRHQTNTNQDPRMMRGGCESLTSGTGPSGL